MIETKSENVVHIRKCKEKKAINAIMTYNEGNVREIEKEIKRIIEEFEEKKIVIEGDFNIRIGELGGDGEDWGMIRKSKDKYIGNGGNSLIDCMQNCGLEVLNGRIKGDWEGEFTYIGSRGNTVIDYVFVNGRMLDKVTKLKVEERVDSDHMPIKMEEEIEETSGEGRREIGEEESRSTKLKKRDIICWDTEAKEVYTKKTEEWDEGEKENTEEVQLEAKWEKLKGFVRNAMVHKTVKIRKKEIGIGGTEAARKRRER
jgi:hypothetical protein